MKNFQAPYISIIFLLLSNSSYSQTEQKQTATNKSDLGLSVQVYPAGIIATVNSEVILNAKSSMLFRLGGNFTNRKDYSPYNDNEKGSGVGGTIGYRRHFNLKRGEIIAGMNIDVWNMWIKWKDNVNETASAQGTTYTLVIQPWLEAGYFMKINHSPLKLGITTGFGREINVITNGEPVGQGWMNSLLMFVQYSL